MPNDTRALLERASRFIAACDDPYQMLNLDDDAFVDSIELLHLADEIEALRKENADYAESDMALTEKVRSLSAHESCGCSYDSPTVMCSHHSPRLAKAEAEVKALREYRASVQRTRHHALETLLDAEQRHDEAAMAEAAQLGGGGR